MNPSHSNKPPGTRKLVIPARDRVFSEEDLERTLRRFVDLDRKREHQLRHSPWRRRKQGQ
jgi:hypothetical protein